MPHLSWNFFHRATKHQFKNLTCQDPLCYVSLSFIYQKVKVFERQEYPSNVFPGLLEPAYFKTYFVCGVTAVSNRWNKTTQLPSGGEDASHFVCDVFRWTCLCLVRVSQLYLWIHIYLHIWYKQLILTTIFKYKPLQKKKRKRDFFFV